MELDPGGMGRGWGSNMQVQAGLNSQCRQAGTNELSLSDARMNSMDHNVATHSCCAAAVFIHFQSFHILK